MTFPKTSMRRLAPWPGGYLRHTDLIVGRAGTNPHAYLVGKEALARCPAFPFRSQRVRRFEPCSSTQPPSAPRSMPPRHRRRSPYRCRRISYARMVKQSWRPTCIISSLRRWTWSRASYRSRSDRWYKRPAILKKYAVMAGRLEQNAAAAGGWHCSRPLTCKRIGGEKDGMRHGPISRTILYAAVLMAAGPGTRMFAG